jgi:hypothetical protein
MPRRRYRWAVVPVLAAAGLSACGGGGSHPRAVDAAPTTSSPTTPAPTTTSTRPAPTTTTASTTAPTTATTVPAFTATVAAVTAADLPYTWRPGCPLAPASLRMIHLSYWGFDGRSHTGSIVVNTTVVAAVVTIFRTLYADRFPIYEMVPQDAYHGNDDSAAAADDTSGFNCRDAVAPGPPQRSVHAFGEAIDVNDVQNPYVDGSTIIPPAGAAYLDRADVRPGMAYRGGVLVDAFASVGWQWGGRWSPGTDYQHFSSTGG